MKAALAAAALLALALVAPTASAALMSAEVWADGKQMCGRADVGTTHDGIACTVNGACLHFWLCAWGEGGERIEV